MKKLFYKKNKNNNTCHVSVLSEYFLLFIQSGLSTQNAFQKATLSLSKSLIKDHCELILFRIDTGYSFSLSLEHAINCHKTPFILRAYKKITV